MRALHIFPCTTGKKDIPTSGLPAKSKQLSQQLTDLRMRKPFELIKGIPSIQLTEDEIEEVRLLLRKTREEK